MRPRPKQRALARGRGLGGGGLKLHKVISKVTRPLTKLKLSMYTFEPGKCSFILTKLAPLLFILLFILITNCVVRGMVFSTTEVCLLTCSVRAEADAILSRSHLKLCPFLHFRSLSHYCSEFINYLLCIQCYLVDLTLDTPKMNKTFESKFGTLN